MLWNLFLAVALVLFFGLTGLGLYLRRKETRSKWLSIRNIIFAATAAAAFALVIPAQLSNGGVDGVIISLQSTFQVFSLDGDFAEIQNAVACTSPVLSWIYLVFSALLFVLAPILTVSVVLSFFHDANAYFSLALHRNHPIYVFSELNENALALAASCKKREEEQGGKAILLFTDVFPSNEESSYELEDRAERMGALCFRRDILALRLPKQRKLSFFILGEDDSENIQHSLELIKRYGRQEDASLFAFTTTTESALLLGCAMNEDLKMTVRRINQAQSLVYSYLYNRNIFANAIPLPNGEKLLRIAIVGMGRYGTEFLKGLTWAGQVPRYHLELNVFDSDPLAEERFSSLCPELMAMNNNSIEGEAHYNIIFHHTDPQHKGMDVRTKAFDDRIASLGDVSLAFVALGSDADDVEVSMKLRTLFRRHSKNCVPIIEAVVYQPTKAELVTQGKFIDYRGNDADIHFIGDLQDIYSYDVIVNSELEQAAKDRHLLWCDKADAEAVRSETVKFYRFEYFYRSSMASVIRRRIRSKMGVPGIDKPPKERTEEERRAIQRMEHAGWNAYMRTEGFCCGPRDDLAKLHHLLIPFDRLPLSEQLKDDD